jgi:glycosyltransferase involved in cell wall biosynthesis
VIHNESVREWNAPAWSAAEESTAPVSAGNAKKQQIGVVVIGRNEGERLLRCLRSVTATADWIVYVDSGSTDGSVDAARAMGVAIVELDLRIPFTPGRARNEGYRRLRALAADLDYVQFVDGDCEVSPEWLGQATAFLNARPDVAVLGGRRHESYPERSVYNLICAMEWETHAVGEATACGGDALMRADAFAAVNGYRPDLMAGEEPELCDRLRAAGWRIWFLDVPLTLHDAAMLRFGQWWARAARSGYGSMQRALLCATPTRLEGVRDLLSSWVWALVLPLVAIALSLIWCAWALALLLLYPVQVVRVALCSRHGDSWSCNLRYSLFLLLAKLPKLIGQLTFLGHHWGKRPARLIEYKS